MKTRELLERDGISFFTYTPSDCKPFTFIVKELPETNGMKDVQEYLDEQQMTLNVLKINNKV